MANPALLDKLAHKDVRVITQRSASYGDNVMSCMVFTFEFRRLQSHYPLVLQQDAGGNFFPQALFGFQKGENLYLDASGWNASYVPAMIRREPFLIGLQTSHEVTDERRLLSIDMDHPRVNTSKGEPLFQPLGGNTPFLEQSANLLETIYQGIEHTRAFMSVLQEHQLVETMNFEIELNDGSRNQLIGYHGIDERRVQQLDGPVLEQFSQRGFLLPLFMMLASLSSMQRLIDLKNAAHEGSSE